MDSTHIKKLLSIGFPLVEMNTESFTTREGDGHVCYMCGSPVIEVEGKFYVEPSLDTLIGSCKKPMQINIGLDGCGVWIGNTHNKEIYAEGKTPKEAVINLLASLKTS